MSGIPAAVPTPPPSLQQQTQRLLAQVQQAQSRQAQADAEVERHLPAVEQAVAAIRRRFAAHARIAARAA
ncbi:hypothetical protein, partial [Xanthomonas sp. SHU 166]